jgi:tRNA(Ile)-lysidine synthase
MLANELIKAWPVGRWEHRKLLVGVSGGADSVALLCALFELARPGHVVAAHFNHGWRGDESDADQKFVEQLCQQLGVPCTTASAPAPQYASPLALSQNDDSSCVETAMHAKGIKFDEKPVFSAGKSEEAARALRYDFLIRAAYECGASYVVTGHTADDRTETLLHNLFRGSGLAGAASLRQFRKLDEDLVLVRPLIARTREDVLQYLAE